MKLLEVWKMQWCCVVFSYKLHFMNDLRCKIFSRMHIKQHLIWKTNRHSMQLLKWCPLSRSSHLFASNSFHLPPISLLPFLPPLDFVSGPRFTNWDMRMKREKKKKGDGAEGLAVGLGHFCYGQTMADIHPANWLADVEESGTTSTSRSEDKRLRNDRIQMAIACVKNKVCQRFKKTCSCFFFVWVLNKFK